MLLSLPNHHSNLTYPTSYFGPRTEVPIHSHPAKQFHHNPTVPLILDPLIPPTENSYRSNRILKKIRKSKQSPTDSAATESLSLTGCFVFPHLSLQGPTFAEFRPRQSFPAGQPPSHPSFRTEPPPILPASPGPVPQNRAISGDWPLRLLVLRLPPSRSSRRALTLRLPWSTAPMPSSCSLRVPTNSSDFIVPSLETRQPDADLRLLSPRPESRRQSAQHSSARSLRYSSPPFPPRRPQLTVYSSPRPANRLSIDACRPCCTRPEPPPHGACPRRLLLPNFSDSKPITVGHLSGRPALPFRSPKHP